MKIALVLIVLALMIVFLFEAHHIGYIGGRFDEKIRRSNRMKKRKETHTGDVSLSSFYEK